MATGHIRVRNACSFPVTFYALAGPSLNLAPNEKKTARACLIWFSTRVKGPGKAYNIEFFEQFRKDYVDQINDLDIDASDYEEGGSGAFAGCFLGWTVGELQHIFKVKNTQYNKETYFGDKKEGVYGGGSDLVVYATLDPVCKLSSALKLVWYLHLEYDHGQKSDTVPYRAPDLSKYDSVMFFRLRNVSLGIYLDVNGQENVTTTSNSSPYDPLRHSQYWTISPVESGGTDLHILNIVHNKLLSVYQTPFDYRYRWHFKTGLTSIDVDDSLNLRWKVHRNSKDPFSILLENQFKGAHLNINNGELRCDPYIDSANVSWNVEVFVDDISRIPDRVYFRIMHCATGKYITMDKALYFSLEDFVARQDTEKKYQTFYLRKHGGNDVKFCTGEGHYIVFDQATNALRAQPDNSSDNPNQHWATTIPNDHCGFFLRNKSSLEEHLYYKDDHYGLYGGSYSDQRWIIQLHLSSVNFTPFRTD
jgi:hypothetical protein